MTPPTTHTSRTPPGAARRFPRPTDPRNLYDAVEHSSRAAGNKRRPARIETGSEDEIFPVARRNLGVNLTREALRNYAMHRGQIQQLRVNIVGPLGKLLVLTGDDWGRSAQDWFNGEWAESAEFFAGLPWGEWLQLVVSAIANEGDVVAAFDAGEISGEPGSGRIVTWEADQVCPMRAADFRAAFPAGWTQQAGVICDELGREVGVVVTSRRGASEVPAGECLVLRADPYTPRRDRWWVHVKRHWRVRQSRGIAPALSSIALAMDAYEVLSAELQSAKVNAAIAAIVAREVGTAELTDADLAEADPTVGEPAPVNADNGADIAGVLEAAENETAPNYERIEALTGGLTEYIDARDKVEFPSISRPNRDLPTFLEYVTDASGAPYGLGHAYARLKADTSYTAFRGDLVMSWVSFRDNQKWLERNVADWAATQAIRWAIRTGRLPAGPTGWERRLAWQWPRMPEVDEGAYQRGIEAALRNGTMTYQELLGPAWREKFAQLAVELRTARELGIPLAVFETRAGAPVRSETQETE